MRGKYYRSITQGLGVAAFLIVTMMSVPGALGASKFKILHSFTGYDGSAPSGLVFDGAGNLYGTTASGGSFNSGTVFELTPNHEGTWTEKLLYSFCSLTNCSDGETPLGTLIFDQAGNLYGTTFNGGSTICLSGCGTVFKLTHNSDGTWTESVLYSFGVPPDGGEVEAGLVFDGSGNLYGTTVSGGSFDSGTVFELTRRGEGTWTESVLHNFTGGEDGGFPSFRLIFDRTGDLYSTTPDGGTHNKGVVFELTPNSNGSWTENVLHQFGDEKDDCFPSAGLTFDGSGNLYGTIDCVFGAVFQLTPNSDGSWKENVLHRFNGRKGGFNPIGDLIFDQSGNLYGTTLDGGNPDCEGFNGCGVVFALAPNSNGEWEEKVLHGFFHHPAAFPLSVIFGSAGNLYGVTEGDSNTALGTVFEITP